MIWALVFGPLGALLFAYGEWRRSKVPPEPELLTSGDNLNVPVKVRVDDAWVQGFLQTWVQGDQEWHGVVSRRVVYDVVTIRL
jgi:hypothetical protein